MCINVLSDTARASQRESVTFRKQLLSLTLSLTSSNPVERVVVSQGFLCRSKIRNMTERELHTHTLTHTLRG